MLGVFASSAILALGATVAAAAPDAEGWGGAGWYVSSDTSPATTARGARGNILFNGPHLERRVCIEIYDRLYSPIGACRYLTIKPAANSG
jgi:hypothetical protein